MKDAVRRHDLATLPLPLRYLRNPLVIVGATYIMAHTIGFRLVGDLARVLLLDSPGHEGNHLWTEGGPCGLFQGWQDAAVIACRLFYPKEVLILVFLPFLFGAGVCWLVQCLQARRFLWVVTRRERRYMVFSMSLVTGASLLWALATLPRFILFTGPIHGFHPLTPLVGATAEFVTPLVIWLTIGRLETRHSACAEAT